MKLLLIIILITACGSAKKDQETNKDSCVLAGEETTYMFEEGVQRAQMYNCDINHKICTKIVSLETGYEIINCNIPPWGQ